MSLGFYFDMTRCSGCGTCTYACKDRMDLSTIGVSPRRFKRFQAGTFPNVANYSTSISCNHCENPACTAVCPTGAMFKGEDGIVLHDDNVCIVCKSCMSACPYGAPQFSEEKNLIIKCDTCKALRERDYKPVCVEACPYRALDFGEIDELKEKYGSKVELIQEIPALPEAAVTTPNLLIKPREASLETSYREITY